MAGLLRRPAAAGGRGETHRDLAAFPDDQRKCASGQGFIPTRGHDVVLVRDTGVATGFGVSETDSHGLKDAPRQFFLEGELAEIGKGILDFSEGTEHGLGPLAGGAVDARPGDLEIGLASTRVEER